MIRSYKYIKTVHGKLHEFIIAFFDRIEFETGDFDNAFFDSEFLVIVKRHPRILRDRCEAIYNEIRGWDQNKRSALCKQIRDSNEIENICRGNYRPQKIGRDSEGSKKTIWELFNDLYKQVLDGEPFRTKYNTTLRSHFNEFSKLNKDITLCPICGIGELKKHEDEARDQYDHYLPKALYPFSSVNFKNLVLTCRECNSFDAKGDADTVAVSTGKFFFPYDETHKGIEINIKILKDDKNIENIEWQITYTNPDNKNEEIQSWRNIYKIDSRHLGHIKARITKWYKIYLEIENSKFMQGLTPQQKKESYIGYLKLDESLGVDFIKRPALEGFLTGSTLAKAAIEMKQYS